jgi:hypothetical protein
MTAQQSSVAPAGFTNSLLITTTSADASLGATQFSLLAQRIEGFNIADLGWGTANAQPVTLSFWVRSSLTGTFGGSFGNGSFNRYYAFSYTINSANTWEQKSITVAGDTTGTWATNNGIGIQVNFGLGVGSTYSGAAGSWGSSALFSTTGATSVIGTLSATWQVTGVQLEKGSTATSFDYRPYGTELALCQRYYYRILAESTASTFTSGMIYLPNYTSSNQKSYSIDIVQEANQTTAYMQMHAMLWSGTSAINRLTFSNYNSNTFATNSTAYLYGVKNA